MFSLGFLVPTFSRVGIPWRLASVARRTSALNRCFTLLLLRFSPPPTAVGSSAALFVSFRTKYSGILRFSVLLHFLPSVGEGRGDRQSSKHAANHHSC